LQCLSRNQTYLVETFITGTTSATAAVAAGSLVTNADLENINAQSEYEFGVRRLCGSPTCALRIHFDPCLSAWTPTKAFLGYGEIRYDCSKGARPDV